MVDNGTLGRRVDNLLTERRTRLGAITRSNVGSEASNVGSRHGSASVVGSAAIRKRRENTHSRASDIDKRAVVGVAVAVVAGVNASDSADLASGTGRVTASVVVVVARRNSHEIALVDHGVGGIV